MNPIDKITKKGTPLSEILYLESRFSHSARHSVLRFICWLLTLLVVLLFFNIFFKASFDITPQIFGIILIAVSVWLFLFSVELFFRFYYSDTLESVLDGARILYENKNGDISGSLISSKFGQRLLARAGVDQEARQSFIKSRRGFYNLKLSEELLGEGFTTKGLGLSIYDQDYEFSKFLSQQQINRDEFSGALDWLILENRIASFKENKFSKKHLEDIRGLAGNWSYGVTFTLDKYAKDLTFTSRLPSYIKVPTFEDNIDMMNSILSKSGDANLILIGEPWATANYVIPGLASRIVKGEVSSLLSKRRMMSLNYNALIASAKEKSNFENEFLKIFNEAAKAGNMILVIDDLPSFIQSAQQIGSDLGNLMSPYLEAAVQIVAISDPDRFHGVIEKNSSLMKGFDQVKIRDLKEDEVVRILENVGMEIEAKEGIYFTFPAILAIAKGADRYFSYGSMPDKAIDLLYKVVTGRRDNKKLITKKDVLNFIQLETNIPLGEISAGEKNKLTNLENILHERVVGQNRAIEAVSNAMRRGRLDIQNPKKPMGSFLFLGPTGVGKTETAKALAQVFFGDEKYLLRLDMTEYQSSDALNRLIGSFEGGKPGILSNMLRENPYGVLLLDEFEKTDKDVLNLFLQILDEGFFSDMNGKKINARNIIFIATSNAASDIIFDLVGKNQDINDSKNSLIKYIIDKNIFKPELVNRFDDVVIFEPLSPVQLKEIVNIMLGKLRNRLKDKGLDLTINDYLVDYVAKEGFNPVFGARPMNRAIQEKVEQTIAQKIIKGEISSGSTIEFKEGDLV